jgi:hypothetical protein
MNRYILEKFIQYLIYINIEINYRLVPARDAQIAINADEHNFIKITLYLLLEIIIKINWQKNIINYTPKGNQPISKKLSFVENENKIRKVAIIEKVNFPVIRKIAGKKMSVSNHEYLAVELNKIPILDFLGRYACVQLNLGELFKPYNVYSLVSAGRVSEYFRLADLALIEKQIILSKYRQKIPRNFDREGLISLIPSYIYSSIYNWKKTIEIYKLPIEFGMLSALLLSKEIKEILNENKPIPLGCDKHLVYPPIRIPNSVFFKYLYLSHLHYASYLEQVKKYPAAKNVRNTLKQKESKYSQEILEAFQISSLEEAEDLCLGIVSE